MDLDYHHRQTGWVMLAIAAITTALICALLLMAAPRIVPATFVVLLPFVGLMGAVAILFSSMTVQLEKDSLSWHFGPRFWRNTLRLADIEKASAITSKWYWGYGIKYFGPGRWLYNVSGSDVVELTLRDGGWVRLGTDDADGLLHALSARGVQARSLPQRR